MGARGSRNTRITQQSLIGRAAPMLPGMEFFNSFHSMTKENAK
jgi:hypothetical protein